MVSGAAQLVMAPVAALLEMRMNPRLLIAIGFVLSTAIFLAFSKILSLTLPSGPLENLF